MLYIIKEFGETQVKLYGDDGRADDDGDKFGKILLLCWKQILR